MCVIDWVKELRGMKKRTAFHYIYMFSCDSLMKKIDGKGNYAIQMMSVLY